VTELVQPLAADEVTSRHDQIAAEHDPSFSELIYAHHAWWLQARKNPSHAAEATATYQRILKRFERSHGRIVHAYWCSEMESAIALTERVRHHWFKRRTFGFHRESDWITRDHPAIAAELHRCDELAVRAEDVLTGVRQRICLQLVTASAAHLLSLVDGPPPSDDETAQLALEREQKGLDKVEAYYRQAANGQAQITYFAGMASVALVVCVVAALILASGWSNGVAALIAGSLGGVVSVVQRINAGDFELEYDVGRPYAFFLGGLRPLIGGALAVAISYAFLGGLLHLPISAKDPTSDERLALMVISFFAGFSERWAQDTLAATVPGAQAKPRPTTPLTTTPTDPPPHDG
jgi:hypothetical protein